MISYRTVIAAAALALVAGTAHAEGLSPSEGRSIHLGDVAGVAYYTVDRDGFRVTATLAQGEAGTPVRVVGTLAPGQSLVLSTPHEVGTPASTVAFRREGDHDAGREVGRRGLSRAGTRRAAFGGRRY